MKRPRVRGSSEAAVPKTRTTNSWLPGGPRVVSIEPPWPNNRICQQCQPAAQPARINSDPGVLRISQPVYQLGGAKTASMRKLFQGSQIPTFLHSITSAVQMERRAHDIDT